MPDRQYNGGQHLHQQAGANGRVVASREHRAGATPMPGTPSRRNKSRESLAVQDPGLKDYVGGPLFLARLPLV